MVISVSVVYYTEMTTIKTSLNDDYDFLIFLPFCKMVITFFFL